MNLQKKTQNISFKTHQNTAILVNYSRFVLSDLYAKAMILIINVEVGENVLLFMFLLFSVVHNNKSISKTGSSTIFTDIAQSRMNYLLCISHFVSF